MVYTAAQWSKLEAHFNNFTQRVFIFDWYYLKERYTVFHVIKQFFVTKFENDIRLGKEDKIESQRILMNYNKKLELIR